MCRKVVPHKGYKWHGVSTNCRPVISGLCNSFVMQLLYGFSPSSESYYPWVVSSGNFDCIMFNKATGLLDHDGLILRNCAGD
eukprot:5431972-Heterocapsa_arctica.AAC.1